MIYLNRPYLSMTRRFLLPYFISQLLYLSIYICHLSIPSSHHHLHSKLPSIKWQQCLVLIHPSSQVSPALWLNGLSLGSLVACCSPRHRLFSQTSRGLRVPLVRSYAWSSMRRTRPPVTTVMSRLFHCLIWLEHASAFLDYLQPQALIPLLLIK